MNMVKAIFMRNKESEKSPLETGNLPEPRNGTRGFSRH